MNKVILIGGAPAAGKSYIAQKLAEELGLPWISTDQIRTIQRSVIGDSGSESLPKASLDLLSPEEVVAEEMKENEVVWRGVIAFIERYYPWEECVVEGVAILPHLVARDLSQKGSIQPVFLVHDNDAKIVELVLERSKLPFIKTKTDEQQKLKVAQIQILNDRIISEAESSGFPCVIAQTEETFDGVKSIL